MHFLLIQMTQLRQYVQRPLSSDPINVSFLNEYNCLLEFATDFDLHKITMTLQQITQWFGYDVIVNCEVVTRDKLHEIEQCREEPGSISKFRYYRQKF